MDALLWAMEGWGASDLFVAEGRPPMVRVDGELRRLAQPVPREEIDELLQRLPRAAEALRTAGEVDCGYSLPDGKRYRLHISRAQGRVTVVARPVPSGALSFESLSLPPGVRALCEHARGLVLVAGSTGSGKSTTLAAMVHHLNVSRRGHIVTVEDPIEFVHDEVLCRVTQREVGTDTPSFGRAVRQALRQSPDVLVIGELRDAESVQAAMSAALTGHLVLATVHTTDTTQTLQRILTFYPEQNRAQAALDLSMALVGVVAQRLLPKVGGGRVVAAEVLTSSPAAARLLREQRVDELLDLMRLDPSHGMVTFSEALLALFRAGTISYEAGVAHATNPEEFALWARGMATSLDVAKERGAARPDLDLRALLVHCLAVGASDLHLASGRPPMVRVNGRLQSLPGAEILSDQDVRMLLFSIMSVRQRTQYELEKEVDLALSVSEGRRFRVNAYFQKGRYAAALRAIPSRIPDAATLGIPEAVMRLVDRPHGLLLVVGPTGSGKSTTLACMVDRINQTRACRVITIEDPIEYLYEPALATVDQREVGADTRSFGAALKYVLRQDPDVILLGEMRDLETISAALTASETGHLVLATLHTNDAIQAVDRIVDVFPPHQQPQVRSQLSSSLLAVVSQRLLARRDQTGRVGAFEVMVGTPAIRNIIREGKLHQAVSMIEASRKEGAVTMDQALQALVESGVVAMEEAGRYFRPKITVR